ncbi:M15 family metallopeptidase [Microbacterium oryzae]|uniref:D-alanyl-D-alanine carboxypeptidase family protein n=1 Tax=Microbacterium oryzae TaxID=743009 RepID=A0A6I6E1U4_9MICO|nr:M15 family metallopeptidase [Microbacterium oryzae]QGU27859.1 D-alanyl-D-alanine carboxypeptidase family protein [Microbacterium oryzae]
MARTSRAHLPRAVIALASAAGVVAVCTLGAAWAMSHEDPSVDSATVKTTQREDPRPGSVEALPVPSFEVVVEEPCERSGDLDDAEAISELLSTETGAAEFRRAAAAGCVALDDPSTTWAVVNKQRPLEPIDYAPDVRTPSATRSLVGGGLRPEAAAALDALAADAVEAGAGEIALQSGYRSYGTQVSTFEGQLGALGEEGAEAISARPGFSEHQLGLAADVVACTSGRCGTIYEIAGTPQGDWLAENAWRHGWIVRYEEGQTPTSGYDPEPWHLRFVGVELARSYHDGGFHTLEDFFGLPAAADYAD